MCKEMKQGMTPQDGDQEANDQVGGFKEHQMVPGIRCPTDGSLGDHVTREQIEGGSSGGEEIGKSV